MFPLGQRVRPASKRWRGAWLSLPETRLDLYVTPQFTYEKFDDYAVFGKFQNPVLPDAEVISPEFSISTTGISAGADYLFPNGLLLGGAFTYSHANYDFDPVLVTQLLAAHGTEVTGALGEPLDRSYDEYGFTLAAGYLKDPWAVLFTGRYARRDNIETLRREAESVVSSIHFIVQAKGDTHSNVYSAGLSVNYRVGFENGAALTGFVFYSFISVEDIDSYTESGRIGICSDVGSDKSSRFPKVSSSRPGRLAI